MLWDVLYSTCGEYNEKKQGLDEIADMFPDILQWVTWWDARKFHMFPTFRHFGYSNITLAKTGNATFKHHTQLWLLDAAQDDTSPMPTQINELHSFIAQTSYLAAEDHAPLPITGNIETPKYVWQKLMQLNLAISLPGEKPLRRTQIYRYLCQPVV